MKGLTCSPYPLLSAIISSPWKMVHWDDALVIKIADGFTQTVRTVADAENILLSQWNRFKLDSLSVAITVCLLCTHDIGSTEDARLAFEMPLRCQEFWLNSLAEHDLSESISKRPKHVRYPSVSRLIKLMTRGARIKHS